MSDNNQFRQELAALLNRYSMENGSNTPDFLLADYLIACLRVLEGVTSEREAWYGIKLKPGGVDLVEALRPAEGECK